MQMYTNEGVSTRGRAAIVQRLQGLAELHAAFGSGTHQTDTIDSMPMQVHIDVPPCAGDTLGTCRRAIPIVPNPSKPWLRAFKNAILPWLEKVAGLSKIKCALPLGVEVCKHVSCCSQFDRIWVAINSQSSD